MFDESRERELDAIRAIATGKKQVWHCQKCGRPFIPKDGGDATAVCPECAPKLKQPRWHVTDPKGTVELRR